ncbi:hypothetical protein I2486_21445 [Cellulophaga sp. E16_2]|uniref:hypothetical protein n=1 Tax=Cellulophaga sp. E16_2 TaxID=2789297 RepID=UPI001A92B757|nr:hypothetical protein [Cellulophaga sp. E16_2]MBO0593973.1 hypothetical protein [Cellulophaga sp. E16_2]
MNQKIVPIITSVGKIWGRDAIFLDEVKIIDETTIEIIGSFNGNLCENLKDDSDKKYSIIFSSVHLFKMIELDYDEIEYESSFDEVKNSNQLVKMINMDKEMHIGKIDKDYKHFVFRTYDTVFEIIGMRFELNLK